MKRIDLTESTIEQHYLYCRGHENNNRKTSATSCYGRLINYNVQNKEHLRFNEEVSEHIVKKLLDEQFFERIIKSKPEVLIEIENDLYSEIAMLTDVSIENIQSETFEFFEYIFNYTKFMNRASVNLWTPHKLTQSLEVTVCPYCNSQFISTIKNNGVSLRPQLDHFFPKSSHPLLALSIYNLIPSCSNCNASLKGDNELSLEDTIHPYIDDFDEIAYFKRVFRIDDKNIDIYSQIVGRENDFNVKIFSKQKENVTKVKGFTNQFALEQRMDFHKKIIQDEIKKSIIYSESYQMGLIESFSRLFDINSPIEKILIQDNINNNILSKLKNDVLGNEILSRELPFNFKAYKE